MNPPSIIEVTGYLTGVFKMVQGEEEGLDHLDISLQGFWRSFWALIYSIPALCVIWAIERDLRLRADASLEIGMSAFARDAVTEFLSVAAVLLAVAVLSRPMGIADRFVHWVVSTNWLTLPVSYVLAAVYLAAASLASGMLIILIALVITLIVNWRVYRVALAGDGLLAVAVLLISLFVAFSISFVVGS